MEFGAQKVKPCWLQQHNLAINQDHTMASIQVMRERFRSEPMMSTQLPVTLDNGCKVIELTGTCNHCNQTVHDNALRGVVTKSFGLIVFDGHGLCIPCMKLFPVFGRVKPHGNSMKLEYIHQGKWVYSLMIYENTYQRLKYHLSRLTKLINR